MKFDRADVVTSIVWQLRLGDWPRAQNRALIQSLFNGDPPFTPEQIQDSLGATNVNDLSAVTLSHDARKNFANAFQKPGRYFTVRLNTGPAHKRQQYSEVITDEINRVMKRSKRYFEVDRSTFANVVLYGIGPVVWMNDYCWCPTAKGVGDILIPSGTLLDMDNLPFYATYERFTAAQLKRMTSGPAVDKGWNLPAIEAAMRWADSEAQTLYSSQWPEVWSPERINERIKEDGGLYSSDAVPTIDCYDFRFFSDEDGSQGWRRRMVVDPWGGWAGAGGAPAGQPTADQPAQFSKIHTAVKDKGFIFDSGDRIYGEKLDQMAHFQFADLSAFAPFRYHSVRSLGFLIYALAHVNNRLWCRFLDHTFENMMQYFRINSDEDISRALKVNLADKGFIDKSLTMIPQTERWQVNQAIVEMAFAMNDEKMGRNSRSLAEESPGKPDHMKATVYMGEVNKANALVSAAMDQAYNYQTFRYEEICRRFCIKLSNDPGVKEFRSRCIQRGVPEKYLNSVLWDIEAERTMGGGNQMLEQQIAQQLMQFRPLFDPDAQRLILRKATMAITSDPDLTDALVPDKPNPVTDTVADAQRAASTLFLGMHVDPRPGENHQEVAKTIMGELALLLARYQKVQPSMEDIAGMQNMALFVQQQLQLLSQDKEALPLVKNLNADLQQMMKQVGMMAKAIEAKMQDQAAQQPPGNAEAAAEAATTAAKLQAIKVQADAKAANARESHAQRTAERATQNEIKMQQDAQRHQQTLQQKAQADSLALHTQAQKDALDIEHQKATAEAKRKAMESKATEKSTAE